MAVKKSLLSGTVNINDILDTQEALDQGILASAYVGKTAERKVKKDLFGITGTKTKGGEEFVATKDNLGSQIDELRSKVGESPLDVTSSILDYKKRRKEQVTAKQAGLTTTQSILGGSAF